MNVKKLLKVFCLAAVALACPHIAKSNEFPYVLSDPFQTMPDVVEKGVVLPGDKTRIPQANQKNFAMPLTLAEAIDLALSNNKKMRGAWADVKIQAGTLGQADANYLPSINASTNWTKDNIRYSDSRYVSTNANKYTFQASATWRMFDFGGRSAYRSAADKLLTAALASYDDSLQTAMGEVIKSYFDVMTTNASLKAKTKDEEIAQSTLQSAKEREARGTISRLDTLRATTALAKASLDKNRAMGDFQKALAVLAYHLGVPSDTELSLPQDLDENQGGILERKELTLWLEEAQKSHPSIIAARKQLEASQLQVIVAKSAGLPAVNLSGNYYQNTRPGEAVTPTGAEETTLMVSLSIPLFDGFASTYKLRGAQAKVDKQEADLADTEQQVAMGIVKAYSDSISALRNLEASAKLLESAQSALAVSQRKYEKGAADITEVLNTQAALADAWNDRIRCLSEWHSSRLQLLTCAGRMGRYAVTTF
ncbi:MAG: TolC family protein [Desulfuromonadaceae bacterium]|nr:TolC family protein [Desulfuromonadaceae bacterium]MDD5106175.1 TolC family protein [Desulfuromonadaceae bacterium]